MKVSLCSQSLFALGLSEAVRATAEIGAPAIELACMKPHLDPGSVAERAKDVADEIRRAGLTVSALSLFNNFTDPSVLDRQVAAAIGHIRLAPVFQTRVIKLTPGPPGSHAAGDGHWRCLAEALKRLAPVAKQVGVRLAFETHMRQLTDTLDSSRRFLDMTPTDEFGLTVDFSNLAFAGEEMPKVIQALQGRIYNTHVKNGHTDPQGGWHFQALDKGLVNYAEVLGLLRKTGYAGYLSIECLSPEAKETPKETARRDLEILHGFLRDAG
jgi:sugar phosphate isomerase/epimerase